MKNSLFLSTTKTPFGNLTIGVYDNSVCIIRFEDKKDNGEFITKFLSETGLNAVYSELPLHKKVSIQVANFFNGSLTTFTFPMKMFGNDIQLDVWEKLYTLKLSENIKLRELAHSVGLFDLRLVEEACISNPICLAIPSHRVEGINVYSGGANRKRLLNRFETFFINFIKFDQVETVRKAA
jgi:methylated-DNA-[protein]-cysteine S-methyltransferase